MPRSIKILVIIMAVNVTGAFILMPLHTIYMHNMLGKSLTFTGFILMLNQGFLVMGNLVGGILFDKVSPYKTVLYGILFTLVSAIALVFLHTNVIWYSILLILMGFGTGVVWPVIYAMAGALWQAGGRRPFNAIFVALNFGVAMGAMIGGYLASISFDYIFIANALIFALSLITVLVKFREVDKERERLVDTTDTTDTPIIEETKKGGKGKPFSALLILSFGFVFIWVAYSQWMTTIASHIQDIGIPLEQYSTLWAINGFLIVLGQPLINLFIKKVPSQKMQIHVGNTILIAAFFIVLFAENFPMFIVAMIILTAGEMLVSPAFPTMANELAPRGQAGFYQGFINSAASSGRMLGPLIGGILIDIYSITTFIIILLFLMLITYLTTQIYDYRIGRTKITQKKT